MTAPSSGKVQDDSNPTSDRLRGDLFQRQDRGESIDSDAFVAAPPRHADALRSLFRDLEALQPRDSTTGEQAKTVVRPPAADENDGPGESPSSQDLSRADTGKGPPGVVAASEELPVSFGRYRIVRELGRGGMGRVYLAHDPELDRAVALKAPGPDDLDAEGRARFLREARALARVKHPNICQVHDVGEIAGRPFLAMEYIRGKTLSEILKSAHAHPPRVAAALVRKLALAMGDVHKAGVVHRDIKPGNIMIDSRGEPIVTDFGLARPLDGAVDLVATGNRILGTPQYMSPEQCRRAADAGPQSDIWSLGVVFYQMLAGRPPFRGDNLVEILGAIAHQPITSPAEGRPDVPPELAAVCMKMLERDPARRYSRMADVANDLTAALRPSEAKKPEPRRTSAPLAEDPPEANEPPLRTAPRRTRKPAIRETGPSSVVSRFLSWTGRGRTASTLVALVLVPGMIALVAMVAILLRRGDVTVRVEIDDSLRGQNVTVVVDGDVYEVRNLGEPIRVKPGRHVMEIRRGEERFKTDEFTIVRDDKPVFRITLVENELRLDRVEPSGEARPMAGERVAPPPATPAWNDWPAGAPRPAVVPFNAEQARRHQREWADHLRLPVEFTNSIGMKFQLLPPGEFPMGTANEDLEALIALAGTDEGAKRLIRREVPRHTVVLTRPIYVGAHEVTQNQYLAVMKVNPSAFSEKGLLAETIARLDNRDTASFPVEMVAWFDAAEFCQRLCRLESLKPIYAREGDLVSILPGDGYRLPTEAEWEFACAAGTVSRFWTGDRDEDLARSGWCGLNSGNRTHAVGTLLPNPFGLFDVHGNVAEWVQDRCDVANQDYQPRDGQRTVNPQGSANDQQRAVRSSDFTLAPVVSRTRRRWGVGAEFKRPGLGFRVVLPIDGARETLKGREKAS